MGNASKETSGAGSKGVPSTGSPLLLSWCPHTILLSPIPLWKEHGSALKPTQSGDIKLINYPAKMKTNEEEECESIHRHRHKSGFVFLHIDAYIFVRAEVINTLF